MCWYSNAAFRIKAQEAGLKGSELDNLVSTASDRARVSLCYCNRDLYLRAQEFEAAEEEAKRREEERAQQAARRSTISSLLADKSKDKDKV
mgnify:CR=1 FL=1